MISQINKQRVIQFILKKLVKQCRENGFDFLAAITEVIHICRIKESHKNVHHITLSNETILIKKEHEYPEISVIDGIRQGVSWLF